MRNALHRALLRRLLLRSSVLSAFALAFWAVLAPVSWFDGGFGAVEPMLGRALVGVLAMALLAIPAVVVLSAGRRPRARVTAPRAAVSGY